jgi:hypothetical protein
MGNTLVNSMVRGFGLTLGRKAANAVTSPRQSQKSVETVSFSKKQQELIKTYEDALEGLVKIDDETEGYWKDGKITENEYKILKFQLREQVLEATTELEKVKSLGKTTGRPFWKTLVYGVIIIYTAIWVIKIINGL